MGGGWALPTCIWEEVPLPPACNSFCLFTDLPGCHLGLFLPPPAWDHSGTLKVSCTANSASCLGHTGRASLPAISATTCNSTSFYHPTYHHFRCILPGCLHKCGMPPPGRGYNSCILDALPHFTFCYSRYIFHYLLYYDGRLFYLQAAKEPACYHLFYCSRWNTACLFSYLTIFSAPADLCHYVTICVIPFSGGLTTVLGWVIHLPTCLGGLTGTRAGLLVFISGHFVHYLPACHLVGLGLWECQSATYHSIYLGDRRGHAFVWDCIT